MMIVQTPIKPPKTCSMGQDPRFMIYFLQRQSSQQLLFHCIRPIVLYSISLKNCQHNSFQAYQCYSLSILREDNAGETVLPTTISRRHDISLRFPLLPRRNISLFAGMLFLTQIIFVPKKSDFDTQLHELYALVSYTGNCSKVLSSS